MFAPSPFKAGYPDSDLQTDSSELDEMSAAKRARTAEIVPYTEVDVSKLELSVREDEKYGKFVTVMMDEKIPHLNLTPGCSLKVLFGLDMGGKMEPRSFNSDAAAKPNESLSLRVVVERAAADVLQKFDRKCQELYEEKGLKGEWMPMLATPGMQGNYTLPDFARLARLQVCLKGDCTAITVKDGDEVLSGSGWEWLNSFEAGKKGFRYASIKAAVKPRVWAVGGKCGVSLAVTQLMVKVEKPVVQNIFGRQ